MVNDQMVNYRIGVHIADVSHYVKPGTKTDARLSRTPAAAIAADMPHGFRILFFPDK